MACCCVILVGLSMIVAVGVFIASGQKIEIANEKEVVNTVDTGINGGKFLESRVEPTES